MESRLSTLERRVLVNPSNSTYRFELSLYKKRLGLIHLIPLKSRRVKRFFRGHRHIVCSCKWNGRYWMEVCAKWASRRKAKAIIAKAIEASSWEAFLRDRAYDEEDYW